jgi:hypothetical protein
LGGIYFLLPALFVIFVSFLIITAAAIALMMTSIDEKKARFQALSAFSGTEFTTREAEFMVNHPKGGRLPTGSCSLLPALLPLRPAEGFRYLLTY